MIRITERSLPEPGLRVKLDSHARGRMMGVLSVGPALKEMGRAWLEGAEPSSGSGRHSCPQGLPGSLFLIVRADSPWWTGCGREMAKGAALHRRQAVELVTSGNPVWVRVVP